MKNVVLMTVIGFGATLMLSGCGQKTPKEEVYDLTYNVLVNEGGISGERAECIANKTVEQLSEDDLITVIKTYELKEAGKENEILLSSKYRTSSYTYNQKLQVATYACNQ